MYGKAGAPLSLRGTLTVIDEQREYLYLFSLS